REARMRLYPGPDLRGAGLAEGHRHRPAGEHAQEDRQRGARGARALLRPQDLSRSPRLGAKELEKGRAGPARVRVPAHLLMALFRTRAVVVSRRALGEQDRLVEFYSRDHGKVRGVAKSARRPRSRFVAALEPLTLGELVFFDTGRSELVRVDHFDIVRPFVAVREDLGRLGRGAWMCETLSRLSADRDPHPALFALLVRSLRGLEGTTTPERV